MKMLHWMCGKTKRDMIRNDHIIVLGPHYSVGLAPVVEKMVRNRLRWFVHVDRRQIYYVVKRVD